jgi:hypothetical protein
MPIDAAGLDPVVRQLVLAAIGRGLNQAADRASILSPENVRPSRSRLAPGATQSRSVVSSGAVVSQDGGSVPPNE